MYYKYIIDCIFLYGIHITYNYILNRIYIFHIKNTYKNLYSLCLLLFSFWELQASFSSPPFIRTAVTRTHHQHFCAQPGPSNLLPQVPFFLLP